MAPKKQGTSAAEPKFEVGQEVLADHGHLYYKAKILKTTQDGDRWKYFVHYQGWNPKWDEWTDEVMENNDENRARALELKAELAAKKKNAKSSSKKRKAEAKAEPSNNNPKKKAKQPAKPKDATIEDDSEAVKRPINLRIPGEVKKFLITDWEKITRNKKILKLPCRENVNTILKEFLDNKSRPANAVLLGEMVHGLKECFQKALPLRLLYKFEVPQFTELMANRDTNDKGDEMFLCDVYGAAHLGRLFVKLPELLAQTQMGAGELNTLQGKLIEVLRWLAKNPKYFKSDYLATDRPYHERAADS